MAYREYKVLTIAEGAVGTLLLGASGLPIEQLEETLNREAKDGWQVVFQVIEHRRLYLFWTRETVVLTLGR